MNITLIFALICGVFVTAVLVLVGWLIIKGLKNAMGNGNIAGGEKGKRSGPQA